MVKEVQAYAARNGKLFVSQWEATQEDCIVALTEKFDKEEMRSIILNNRETIYDAIKPLVEFERDIESRNTENCNTTSLGTGDQI